MHRRGISLFTTHVRRTGPADQAPKLKSHSKIDDILAGIQATSAGADGSLMLDDRGFVATCNSDPLLRRAARRDTDGVWAPSWYDGVERSAGFAPPPERGFPDLPDGLKPLAEAGRPLCHRLARRRLGARPLTA